MENFKYLDIFATKGIEYIAVLAFLATLVIFWRLLNTSKPENKISEPLDKVKTTLVDWFYLANDFFYHQGHTWAKAENENIVRVGMDDFSKKLVGSPDMFNLPETGSVLKQGEIGWKLHFKNKTIDMLSPVNGEVVEVNEEILRHPKLIEEDPYQKGWLLKVKPSKFAVDSKNLLSGDLAKAWLENGVNTISNTISGNYGIILQDGGTIKDGFAREIYAEKWDTMAKKFFKSSELN